MVYPESDPNSPNNKKMEMERTRSESDATNTTTDTEEFTFRSHIVTVQDLDNEA